MTNRLDNAQVSITETVSDSVDNRADAGMPLCFVIDPDASVRHFLSLILHGAGVDTQEFVDGTAMTHALSQRRPDLIFLNIGLDSSETIEVLLALYKRGYFGFVQLMSNRGGAVLEHVKNVGDEHRLQMLPILKKPFDTSAVTAIMEMLKLGDPAPSGARVALRDALASNTVEFWLQPKIDLRKKRLVGVETFARVRDPNFGVLPPSAFVQGASDDDILKLCERDLMCALRAGTVLAKTGINLRIAINFTLEALEKLPISDIVRMQYGPEDSWPGLLIDVPEEQVLVDLSHANEIARKLATLNVKLAIDDFREGHAKLARVKELPFAEIKLAHTLVGDCSTDKVHAPLCRTIIDLAHGFGMLAVANGIEKSGDAIALTSMGCDIGQGFLLGQPMPQERLISLVRQRSNDQTRSTESASVR
jgi:EAL domain-containing protein (putative c-di-GMP-specific phosphodiesterase class I)/CheY-like chemotaxis protein